MLNLQFSNFTPKIDPSLEEEGFVSEVCIANISPAERRKRLKFAIIQFAIGIVLLAVLLFVGADKIWRLPLFIMFASGGASYFQWRDKTWVSLAARGSRQLTDKVEKIEDQSELKQVRIQALKVIGKGVLVAIGLTLIVMLIP